MQTYDSSRKGGAGRFQKSGPQSVASFSATSAVNIDTIDETKDNAYVEYRLQVLKRLKQKLR